ncbi:MAG: hypothetical protein MJ090_05255 [Clostridia bacterium]|nr:hypothetical protein [Clostridia bacterium]
MQMQKSPLRIMKILSIFILVLFVALSAFNCITVYEESCNHSQLPLGDNSSVYEPTISESEHNNQLLKVSIISIIEVVLIIFSCYKSCIVVAIFELLLTIGTLCTGYICELFIPIVGSMPQYSVSFEISSIGYFVLCIAILNLAMAVTLQVNNRKNKYKEAESDFGTQLDYTIQN